MDVTINPRNLPVDTPKNDFVGSLSADEPVLCQASLISPYPRYQISKMEVMVQCRTNLIENL